MDVCASISNVAFTYSILCIEETAFLLSPFSLLVSRYHSQLEGGRIPVYAVTFQEPENDPRNCCYLWAIQSTQER